MIPRPEKIVCAVRNYFDHRVRAIASRTGRTIADLRSLSSNLLVEVTERPLNSIVVEALQISEPQIGGADVKMETFFDSNRPIVRVNPALLLQVMLNLIQNAVDSMREVQDRQRTLSVRTLAGSESVLTEFEDNGIGLPDGTAVHPFDPMYTTKKGSMGLGLALCRRGPALRDVRARRVWQGPSPVFRTTQLQSVADRTSDFPDVRSCQLA